MQVIPIVGEIPEALIFRRDDLACFDPHRFLDAAFKCCIRRRDRRELGKILIDDLRLECAPAVAKNVLQLCDRTIECDDVGLSGLNPQRRETRSATLFHPVNAEAGRQWRRRDPISDGKTISWQRDPLAPREAEAGQSCAQLHAYREQAQARPGSVAV